MPYTLKPNKLFVKDPNGSGYLPQNVVTDRTTDDMVAEINAAGANQITAIGNKGAETLETIPDDYTALSNQVDNLESAFKTETDIKNQSIDELCEYVGKASVCDLIPIVTFENGYYNNDIPVLFVPSTSQLVSNIIRVGTGTKLSIKVPSGYRIYIQYLNNSLGKHGGHGWYTSDTDVTALDDYAFFNITKSPYSVSDTISPSEANGFQVYRSVTVASDNLAKRITDVESAVSDSVRYAGNLTASTNIDNLKDTGYYYVTLYGTGRVSGTLPPTLDTSNGTSGFLTVQAYYNFVTQTLVQFLSGRTFVRGASTSASLTFNPWIEISNNENTEPVSMVHSRNLWPFGDLNITGYQMIGTQGTTLFPAGKYTFSCYLTADEDYIKFNVYMSSGVVAKQVTPAPSGYRTIIQINATNPIERFFIQTKSGSYSSYTIQLNDIQFEKIYWSCYEYSSTDNWVHLPYTTPYVSPEIPIDEKLSEYKSNWVGKKIVFNGDSITQGISVAGMAKVGYVRTACQLLNFGIVDNYAIGGTRLAHVENESNCMVDRLNDMPTDADIVFIMANTNDYASQVPIGTNDSTDVTTYKGALNALLTWLRTNYVQKPVIISTQLTRKINTSDGEPLPIAPEEYVQAVRDMVEKYHFILFDAYERSGMDLRTSPQDGTGITNDGLHPNQYGAELLGRKVAAFINAQ